MAKLPDHHLDAQLGLAAEEAHLLEATASMLSCHRRRPSTAPRRPSTASTPDARRLTFARASSTSPVRYSSYSSSSEGSERRRPQSPRKHIHDLAISLDLDSLVRSAKASQPRRQAAVCETCRCRFVACCCERAKRPASALSAVGRRQQWR